MQNQLWGLRGQGTDRLKYLYHLQMLLEVLRTSLLDESLVVDGGVLFSGEAHLPQACTSPLTDFSRPVGTLCFSWWKTLLLTAPAPGMGHLASSRSFAGLNSVVISCQKTDGQKSAWRTVKITAICKKNPKGNTCSRMSMFSSLKYLTAKLPSFRESSTFHIYCVTFCQQHARCFF